MMRVPTAKSLEDFNILVCGCVCDFGDMIAFFLVYLLSFFSFLFYIVIIVYLSILEYQWFQNVG